MTMGDVLVVLLSMNLVGFIELTGPGPRDANGSDLKRGFLSIQDAQNAPVVCVSYFYSASKSSVSSNYKMRMEVLRCD